MSRHLVTFIGDERMPGSNPEATRAFGLDFRLNVPVPLEVTTPEGERILGKLRGNRHFRVESAEETATAPETVSDETVEPVRRRGRPPKVKPDENDE